MNNKIPFTRKMLGLPVIREREMYPHVLTCYYDIVETVGEKLRRLQMDGYRLRYISPPMRYMKFDDDDWLSPIEERGLSGYKLLFLFAFDRGITSRTFLRNGLIHTEMEREREFVKGGFLYDTPEQFERWQRKA